MVSYAWGRGKFSLTIHKTFGCSYNVLLSVSLNRFISRGTSAISKCQIVTKWWVFAQLEIMVYGNTVCHLNLLKQKIMNSLDGLTLYEHPNVLCTVDDTAIATTQVHSSSNEESTNIRGIIQNVTCSVLNMDQCITANITLQLQLRWFFFTA
jgi:hypothetical protein